MYLNFFSIIFAPFLVLIWLSIIWFACLICNTHSGEYVANAFSTTVKYSTKIKVGAWYKNQIIYYTSIPIIGIGKLIYNT